MKNTLAPFDPRCGKAIDETPKPDQDLFECYVNVGNWGIGPSHGFIGTAMAHAGDHEKSVAKISILNGRVVSAETVHEY